MKEATSETSLAVIVAISIGILAAFFFGFLWPTINTNFHRTAQCRNATCDCSESARVNNQCKCTMPSDADEEDTTNYFDEEVFYCPWGG